MSEPFRFTALLQRKQDDLPVFLMVPPAFAARHGQTGTFVVAAVLLGRSIDRRSVKPWGDGRWFMELTKPQLAMLGLAVGDEAEITLSLAPATPPELVQAIEASALHDRWQALSPAVRRQLAESVFAARRESTRASRIARVIDRLRG